MRDNNGKKVRGAITKKTLRTWRGQNSMGAPKRGYSIPAGYQNRPGLAKNAGADALLWSPNRGTLIKRGPRWWASNDIRTALIGIAPNADLAAPTVGPFSNVSRAVTAYERALSDAAGGHS